MTEKLLQYIWRCQMYNQQHLFTTDEQALEIIFPGTLNTNQGPDFLNAKIKISNTTWAGHIELHVLSSHWHKHAHSNDKNYHNIILHVVWQHDTEEHLHFPTLVLQPRVSKLLLHRYKELMNNTLFIPCQNSIKSINEITWIAWKERLLVERFQYKYTTILTYLQNCHQHWEEVLWWLIAKNFGITVNADAFLAIAQSIPINILAKHKNQIHHLEALLFGQAGLLGADFTEAYPTMLQKEYAFYQKKYQLIQPAIQLHFLRMRPANFPTIRLAQLAMLIHQSVHLFATIRDAGSLQDVKASLDVTANDYWHYHYHFDESTAYKKKNLGTQMVDNILINTILPVLFAYGHFHQIDSYKDKALKWLEQIPTEQNNIIRMFQKIDLKSQHAFDSQALIQLKNHYCNQKKCLECAVGNKILKNG